MLRLVRRVLFAAVPCLLVHSLAAQLTVPEATHGARTSSHAEVLGFLDSLQHRGAKMFVGTLGQSTEGKRIPYVILSRPLVTTPAAAHATGKPVLYIEANIHAGEVEGKEAVLMLMRDMTLGYLRPLLDSVVILFVPIYNTDGNDAWGPQDINRGEQDGPERIGLRPNGQGYDLNRDYVKQDAPETRASLAFVSKWNPDLFMDLHTTDGSYHGYALTWSPGLNPNRNPTNTWVQDTVLESIRQRLQIRDHEQTYPYGNFDGGNANPSGWRTYESLPRYGTNLQGMMRVSVLSEAMSHYPLLRRISVTYDFVLETIRYLNEHKVEMRHHEALSAAWRPDSVVIKGNDLSRSPVRMDSVLVEMTDTIRVPRSDSATRANTYRAPVPNAGAACGSAQAAAGRGGRGGRGRGRGFGGGRGGNDSTRDVFLMTDVSRAVWMPVRDRFSPVMKEAIPAAYVFDSSYSDVVPMMRRVGIEVRKVVARAVVPSGRFDVDSMENIHPRDWQGRCNTIVEGTWSAPRTDTIPAGSFLISTNQPHGVVASFLLEPESEDGYALWGFFDRGLSAGHPAPVRRLTSVPLSLRTAPVP